MDRFVKSSEIFERLNINFKGSLYATILFSAKIKNLAVVKGSTIDTVYFKINNGATIANISDLQTAINSTAGSYEIQIIITYTGSNAEGTIVFEYKN